jgi:hypothetical protein
MAEMTDSDWGSFPEAIRAELASWDLLEDWPTNNVHIRKTPWLLTTDETPIILIWTLPERRNAREGMIGLSDFRLRAGVACIRAANRSQTSNAGTNHLWRQTLLTFFDQSGQLRPRMNNLMGTEVEPGIPQDAAVFINKNYDAQYFIVNGRVRVAKAARPSST